MVVSSADNGPTPQGHVSIHWFNNTTCNGGAAANSGSLALDTAGQVDATGFAQTLTATGGSFLAHYTDDTQFPTYNNIAGGVRVGRCCRRRCRS